MKYRCGAIFYVTVDAENEKEAKEIAARKLGDNYFTTVYEDEITTVEKTENGDDIWDALKSIVQGEKK